MAAAKPSISREALPKGFSAWHYFSCALLLLRVYYFCPSISTKSQTIPGCPGSCLYSPHIPFYFITYFGLSLIEVPPTILQLTKLSGPEGTFRVVSCTEGEPGTRRCEMSCPRFWLAGPHPGLKRPSTWPGILPRMYSGMHLKYSQGCIYRGQHPNEQSAPTS